MRVFVDAYGCTLNQGEGRTIARRIAQGGHRLVEAPEAADACVLVTCTVIERTERNMVRRMRELAEDGRKLVVGGCMAAVQEEAIRRVVPSASILPPTRMEELEDHLPPDVADAEYECFEPSGTAEGIVPLTQGCLASCTYCISTVARGTLRSRPPEEVEQEVRDAVGRGRREIRLTALDTGQYGRDLETNLGDLLRRVCNQVEGDYRIRVGMMSPMFLRPVLGDLLRAYPREEKVFNFLHLPVQSGNDDVLRRMKRGYTVDQFWEVVHAFREEVRPLTLSTDVIVGFPGEGTAEWQDTMDLIRELEPDIVNITRFSARPGTPAAEMEERVPGWEVKERSRELTKLRFRIGRRNQSRFVGRRLRVLTTEEGKGATTVARSQDYRPVVLPGRRPLGEFLEVEVEGATATYLKARPVAR